MRRLWVVPMTGLMALGLTACPSYTIMHTAKPIAPGTTEIGVSPTVTGYKVERDDIAAPGVELQLRYGINDMVDCGLKYATQQPIAVTLDFNLNLVNTGSFAISIDPTVTPMYFSYDGGSTVNVSFIAPILMDVISTDSMALTVGAISGLWYGSISGAPDLDVGLTVDGLVFAVGGSVGVKLYVGQTFALMPTFTFMYWLPETENYYTWAAGVGFLL